MIVTLTANPALDRTVELAGRLERGAVLRASGAHVQAGGKGVNVARAVRASGCEALAVFPAAAADPFTRLVEADGLPHVAVPVAGAVRTNVAVTEPDGTTTKLNEPGPVLDAAELAALADAVVAWSRGAAWLVLAGSLPTGAPDDWYAGLVARVRAELGADAPSIAVDTSGAPLRALVAAGDGVALIKPNADELAELAGRDDADDLERDALLAADVARASLGAVESALVTLGAAGAVLVGPDGDRLATAPRITAVSTVGAGDSSLAGYLLTTAEGGSPDAALAQAVALGAAAAALPGSTLPSRASTRPETVPIDHRPAARR